MSSSRKDFESESGDATEEDTSSTSFSRQLRVLASILPDGSSYQLNPESFGFAKRKRFGCLI
jgi:hypothetical protein